MESVLEKDELDLIAKELQAAADEYVLELEACGDKVRAEEVRECLSGEPVKRRMRDSIIAEISYHKTHRSFPFRSYSSDSFGLASMAYDRVRFFTEVHFESFWDLLKYADEREMCTIPGCTTCYCMPFRELCWKVGPDWMNELLSAAEPSRTACAEFAWMYSWYGALTIIRDVVFPNLPADSPLMKQLLIIDEERREERRKRAEAGAAKVRAEQEAAAQRREERAKETAAHVERTVKKNEAFRRISGIAKDLAETYSDNYRGNEITLRREGDDWVLRTNEFRIVLKK